MHKFNDNGDGSSEDSEMEEAVEDPPAQEVNSNTTMKSGSSRKRGRPRIPPKWSRIIEVDIESPSQVQCFDIDEDVSELRSEFIPVPRRSRKEWMPLFQHKRHWQELAQKELGANVLSRRKLKAYAKDASFRREQITDKALAAANLDGPAVADGIHSAAELGDKLLNRGNGKHQYSVKIHPSEYKELTTIGSRKRSNRRPTLTVADKVGIVHRVIIQGHLNKEVSTEF